MNKESGSKTWEELEGLETQFRSSKSDCAALASLIPKVNSLGQSSEYDSEREKAAFLLNDIGEAYAQNCLDNPIGIYGNVYPDINAGVLIVSAYSPDPGISPVSIAALIGALMASHAAGAAITGLASLVMQGFEWAVMATIGWEAILVCALVVAFATLVVAYCFNSGAFADEGGEEENASPEGVMGKCAVCAGERKWV